MLKIGIVGAESSHSLEFARLLNIQKVCGGARITALWGESRDLARSAASAGQIPHIVRHPEEMAGSIDAVIIAHRHPQYHIPTAMPFVKAGIPIFIDKPFCETAAEGRGFLAAARKANVPVSSFSVIPEQACFKKDLLQQIRRAGEIRTIQALAPCDFRSPYGGVYFYGIHLVDMLAKSFGGLITSVQVFREGKKNPNVSAILHYGSSGAVAHVLFVAKSPCSFVINAIGTKGSVNYYNRFDANPYLSSIKKIVRMFRTGRMPYSEEIILQPIAVLEALRRSFLNGAKIRVSCAAIKNN